MLLLWLLSLGYSRTSVSTISRAKDMPQLPANPAGLFTSNFVWDNPWNVPFIYVALAIVALAAFQSQSRRRVVAFGFPLVTIASAVAADWLLYQTPYVNPPYCTRCSVIGMSAVSSASVGAALAVSSANLLISLVGVRDGADDTDDGFKGLRGTLLPPISLFVATFGTLLLFFQSFFFGVPTSTLFTHVTSFILGWGIMTALIWSHTKLRAPLHSQIR